MTDQPKWNCPACKADNTPDFVNCRMCGAPNPAKPPMDRACPSCGFHSDKECCPSCNSPMFLQL